MKCDLPPELFREIIKFLEPWEFINFRIATGLTDLEYTGLLANKYFENYLTDLKLLEHDYFMDGTFLDIQDTIILDGYKTAARTPKWCQPYWRKGCTYWEELSLLIRTKKVDISLNNYYAFDYAWHNRQMDVVELLLPIKRSNYLFFQGPCKNFRLRRCSEKFSFPRICMVKRSTKRKVAPLDIKKVSHNYSF
jgi:hypothetical protein